MAQTKNLLVKDHSVSKEDFELQYDDWYEMFVTHPKPVPEKLGRYYISENYISHTDAKTSITDKLYQQVKKWMVEYKFRLIERYQRPQRLLDIGAGTGDFLIAAKSRNWEIEGVEPSLQAQNLALSKGIQLSENIEQVAGKFEVITLWHVLEHVYDLKKYLNFLKAHLAEQGTVFIAVPNYKSKDASYYGANWAAYDVPRHLYHFSKNSIQKLFEEAGLELIKTKPLIFDAFYVSILSEKYKKSNFQFVRGILQGLDSNFSALRTNEYSSHIYVLKHK